MALAQQTPEPEHRDIGQLMLVDDAPFDHAAARRAAGKLGFAEATMSFFMAEDALDYLGRHDRAPVDLLLVDLHMPRMGGLEFLAEAQKRFGQGFARGIYLTLTLAPDRRTAADIEKLGVIDGWVEKPLTSATLRKLTSGSEAADFH